MAAAYGLYTHIRSNKRRSIGLLIGLFFLIYLMTFAGALIAEALFTEVPPSDLNRYYGDPNSYLMRAAWRDFLAAWPWATVGSLVWIVIAYYFHQSIIDAVTGGQQVTRAEQPRLYNILENLCISRGITMPKLEVMDSDALNAFATGLNEKQYSITVTSGLINTLNDAEIESVLGHELTHIRNGDVRMMVIAVVIAGVISFFGELVFRGLFRSGLSGRSRGKGAGFVLIIALAIVALCWILALVVRFALSRERELLADAGSVELTKNPDAMISALRKIENRGELPGSNSAVMELCIDNPREGFDNIFDTHPSVDARVAALVRFAGGHDPGPLELPPPEEKTPEPDEPAALPGPWRSRSGQPGVPDASGNPQDLGPDGSPPAGPWGPQRSN